MNCDNEETRATQRLYDRLNVTDYSVTVYGEDKDEVIKILNSHNDIVNENVDLKRKLDIANKMIELMSEQLTSHINDVEFVKRYYYMEAINELSRKNDEK